MRARVQESRAMQQQSKSRDQVVQFLQQQQRAGNLTGFHGRLVCTRSVEFHSYYIVFAYSFIIPKYNVQYASLYEYLP